MCGIIGAVAKSGVNQLLYDGLLLLQHRGQDAAGIVTAEGKTFHMCKGPGMVRDVFHTRDMRSLPGEMGIAHCRYPTAGSAFSSAEAQPFYVNSPFGIVLAHNGNLTNSEALKQEMFRQDLRHINTNSDSEVLLNVLAHELELAAKGHRLDPEMIFSAVASVHRRCRGAYAVVAMIAGYGVLAFRDPFGIRPLVIGRNETAQGPEHVVCSETVALTALGFELVRDCAPGEAIFIDEDGAVHSRQCAQKALLSPCIFEYVYLARPDSVMDGVSVYEARLNMGRQLAQKIRRTMPDLKVDVVIPVPDTSRPGALEIANGLGVTYREGFIRNRYIGRTFIMPGQTIRKKSVRQKLSVVAMEFKGKDVFASAAPPVRYPNVYGIDMPNRQELIATGRTEEEIAREIGADAVIYQDLDALKAAVRAANPRLTQFETSCFDGFYVTGDVTKEYLASVEQQRNPARQDADDAASANQLDLNAA
ncbi:MAG: amidophosphoribosyltransferase [Betaproteobacteria bacterium]|nr:amidophosphoribosyltransferase [Betaproteobacteria bacterium]